MKKGELTLVSFLLENSLQRMVKPRKAGRKKKDAK